MQGAQAGVISRRQLREVGVGDDEIERRLRRREWARVYPGVYVDHTGPLTWNQRCWAAVLYHWPAALAGSSALHAYGVRGHEVALESPVEVVVDRSRSVRRHPGICIRQLVRFEQYCNLALSPPRERLEHAVLGVASRRASLDESVGVLADAVQAGRTTAPRLIAALGERTRLRHRAVLRGVLSDVDGGVRSVLEHRYLTRVERAHGLPAGERQRAVRIGAHSAYRDVDYIPYGVGVELDGTMHTDTASARWADFDRDLAVLVSGSVTVRVGWRQVISPCRLAAGVATLLSARGWPGQIQPCSSDCAALSANSAGKAARTPLA